MGVAASSHHEPLDRIDRFDRFERKSFRTRSLRTPKRMDRLRKSLRESLRRKKDHLPESSKPHQWQWDEAGVRSGNCIFLVKYLGCVEVFESRGMSVCEEALKNLRQNPRRRPIKALLSVSGDGLRVTDEYTKGLLVDQTIEKVSFCAPDRSCDRGFSYICRDETTRRWMCHGFLASRDSGERLSHAVGCAFAACLERKQRRDKECGISMAFDQKTSAFTRVGSFKMGTITDKLHDAQDLKQPEPPPPVKSVHNPHAVERPHATPMMLQRQGSFRGFEQLGQASPFKRQLSLRISDLPSNLQRHRAHSLESDSILPNINNNNNNNLNDGSTDLLDTLMFPAKHNGFPKEPDTSQSSNKIPLQRNRLNSLPVTVNMSPIPEVSPITERHTDPLSALCQQISQGLSLLTAEHDPFEETVSSLPLVASSEAEPVYSAGTNTNFNTGCCAKYSTIFEYTAQSLLYQVLLFSACLVVCSSPGNSKTNLLNIAKSYITINSLLLAMLFPVNHNTVSIFNVRLRMFCREFF